MYSLIIIDDEIEQLDGLENFFPWESLGFHVEKSFEDGISALKYLETHDVDVILTDIHLPFMSGLDLIEKVIELNKAKPPIYCIMSAYSEFEYAKRAIGYNVIEYLVKPSSFDEITETFDKIRITLDKSNFKDRAEEHYNHPVIDKALMLMDSHISSCSLQYVADELSIHSAYLSRLFKEVTGENFQDCIIRKRMKIASKMIRSNRIYTNTEIASAIGYQDTQNFCRAFKKYYGITTQQYRLEDLESTHEEK